MRFLEKDGNIKILLKCLCLMSVCIALFSALTRGQAIIHSDTATATLLAQAQLKYRSFFPESWCYGNGDIWVFSSNLFVMPFSILLKNQSLARCCGSALLLSVTIFCVFLFCKKFLKSDFWMILIPVFSLFTFGEYAMILYEAAYVGVMIWFALGLWLSYEMLNGNQKFIVLYFLWVLILGLGGIRIWAELVIPLLGTALFMIYYDNSQDDYDIDKIIIKSGVHTILISVPAIVGFIIYKGICNDHYVVNTTYNSLSFETSAVECIKGILTIPGFVYHIFGIAYPTGVFSTYGIRNIFSILICTILMFIIPVLQYRRFSKEPREIRYILIFTLIHNVEMVICILVFGKNINPRYFLSSVFLLEIVSSRYVYEYWLKKANLNRFIVLFGYTAIVLLYIISLTYPNRRWKSEVEAEKTMCRTIRDHGLSKGYATFWNSYKFEIYSDLGLQFGGLIVNDPETPFDVYECIKPYYWLVDSNRFIPDENTESTFLLLSEDEVHRIRGDLEERFGTFKESFTVEDKDKTYHVYVWDHDIAKEFENG